MDSVKILDKNERLDWYYDEEADVQAQLTVPVPQEVLNTLRIGPEDWRGCWGD